MTGAATRVPGDATAGGPLAGLLVADFSRILAGPYATMLLADLGADVVKVEGPAGTTPAAGSPPVRDGVSTYFLGVNRDKRSIALDLRGRRRRRGGPGAGPARGHRDRELQAGRPGQVRPGLRHRRARPTRGSSTPRSAGSAAGRRRRARLRPDGAGDLRADEPHRRPGRPAVPGRHLGVRRDGRQLHADHRRAGRAAPPRRDRPGPARRGQSAVLRAVRAGQPQLSAYVAGGVVPFRMGNATRACSPTSRCRAPTAT